MPFFDELLQLNPKVIRPKMLIQFPVARSFVAVAAMALVNHNAKKRVLMPAFACHDRASQSIDPVTKAPHDIPPCV
jgi:hypothetical protein